MRSNKKNIEKKTLFKNKLLKRLPLNIFMKEVISQFKNLNIILDGLVKK